MDTHDIEISYTDTDKFKEGMHELRVQIWHIESQMKELEKHHDRLVKMRKDAINYYCDPDNEMDSSKIWIPKHIAKVD